ncbi:MAG: hypothetical protein ABJB73_08980 [Candidatus Nitrosocosmicus sp.]
MSLYMCVGMGGIMWLINRVCKNWNVLEIKGIDKIKEDEENNKTNRKHQNIRVVITMLKKDKNISYYEYFQILLSNKNNLFWFLSIAFVSIIVYPVIIPHLTHLSMIYHIIIHIISFDIILFLIFVSVLSFKKPNFHK